MESAWAWDTPPPSSQSLSYQRHRPHDLRLDAYRSAVPAQTAPAWQSPAAPFSAAAASLGRREASFPGLEGGEQAAGGLWAVHGGPRHLAACWLFVRPGG